MKVEVMTEAKILSATGLRYVYDGCNSSSKNDCGK